MSLEPLWKADAGQIVRDAYEEFKPVVRYALFSGGNDSSVLTHWAWNEGLIDAAVFIDTGTALPGVAQFAHDFCVSRGIPWRWLKTPMSEYERMVLDHGFPGPSQHHRAYIRLKERRVDQLVRQAKEGHPRSACVALLAGCRRVESRRRMGTTQAINKQGGKLWLNPILDWTNADMADYRRKHDLPQSDVAALIHRSGECNCGAYAHPGEREELEQLFPEWFAWIEELELKVRRSGRGRCVWGQPQEESVRWTEDEPLCSDCQLRLAA